MTQGTLLPHAAEFQQRQRCQRVDIESAAAQELRSVNGQIEWLLREGLKRRGRELRVTTRTNNRRLSEDS